MQREHSSSSVKGASRSSHCFRVGSRDASGKRNKSTTNAPSSKSQCCPFHLQIFLDLDDDYWYLKEGGLNDLTHLRHIYVDPQHMVAKSNLLTDEASLFIGNLIENDVDPQGIINLVKEKYNLVLTKEKLRLLKNDSLDKKIHTYIDVQNPSSMDKLIATLKATKGVSFVYVTHDQNSGFVSYVQRKKKTVETALPEEKIGVSSSSMEDWRSSLKVGSDFKVLVSIAWAMDEEVQEFIKFPEYSACDVTFGLNKQQRNMALLVVVDNNNNVSTVGRCYMPSKERRAYKWLFSQAMPFLFPLDRLQRMSICAMDNEQWMNEAFVSTAKSWSPSLKLRLDVFHLLHKPFMKMVVNVENKPILDTIKMWILSWFNYVENEGEYACSREGIDNYINANIDKLGQHNVQNILKIIESISTNQEYCIHYFFVEILH